ncbi:alpha/beta fold hydrolase [Paenibacillus sedimenti]|uniref:Alpha/beta hydrolase n=1 Tax=Paenibacillus sedimenti TaxID=2770274 RepID=A0A926QJ36_9BACL|nr:alpha/beta hydrolase [Paenibacillus sedimenti]MBD0381311.1 alpha/beta hydrolase [Paenibacillus sedimenti]
MNSVMNKTRKLVFKKAQISYYVIENKGKETILMLHPGFADHNIFELQIDHFKDNYQVILIDMPGHGESQIMGSKVTIKDMPEILNQVLFENDIISCHLLGVSLGSLVAQAFADRYPDRVKSVTIVGGYSIHKANERILKAQRTEGLKWILYILFSMKKFRRYVTSVSCHTDVARDMFTRGIQRFSRRSFSAMAGMNTFFTTKDTPMTYPLLIIFGEHDLKLVHEAAMELHQLEKHSQLVLLPGAGHCANADMPNEFNVVVENFYRKKAQFH